MTAFQLHTIINNNLEVKSLNLDPGSKLLMSLKSKVIQLATSSNILLTVQEVAQSTLQAGWSILLPTANERAQTLSSLLPNAALEPTQISCGHRFMTDLLVWSLMVDGGLETALLEALRVEIAELADADETFELTATHSAIPLLHLVKQLLRNGSSLTQLKLEEFKRSGKLPQQKALSSPSVSLLQRFQRLLIGKIYGKEADCVQAAESLLRKYLCQLSVHVTETLNLAHQIGVSNSKSFLFVVQILKGDIIGEF